MISSTVFVTGTQCLFAEAVVLLLLVVAAVIDRTYHQSPMPLRGNFRAVVIGRVLPLCFHPHVVFPSVTYFVAPVRASDYRL